MFKNYDSTYEVIFFSYTSLHFFDRSGEPCSCRLHLQNVALSSKKIFTSRSE